MLPRELAAAELRVLRADLDEVRERLRRLAEEVASVDPGGASSPDRPILALLAIDLHSYYTALETLLERILSAIEGRRPKGPSSHRQLLRETSRALEGVRPAVLGARHLDDLDELRRFRHFFRHAYALDLRWKRMRRVLDPFPAMSAGVERDLARFSDFLGRLAEEIERAE